MTMLNRLANQRFPTTAMTTGAPGVNAMPRRPQQGLDAPGMHWLEQRMMGGELGFEPPVGLPAGVMRVMGLDRVHPRALSFMRELMGQAQDSRPGQSMQRLIKKVAPSTELEGATLHFDSDEVDPLVDLLKHSGAPEGLNRTEFFDFHKRNVMDAAGDAALARDAARAADLELPIQAGGVGGRAIEMKEAGMARATPPDFWDVEEAAQIEGVSDEFIDFLKTRPPAPGTRPDTIFPMSFMDNLARRGPHISYSRQELQRIVDDVLSADIVRLAALIPDTLYEMRRRLIASRQAGDAIPNAGAAADRLRIALQRQGADPG